MPLVDPGMKTVFPEMFMTPVLVVRRGGGRERLSGDPRSLVRAGGGG
jgi:hypothetical protein